MPENSKSEVEFREKLDPNLAREARREKLATQQKPNKKHWWHLNRAAEKKVAPKKRKISPGTQGVRYTQATRGAERQICANRDSPREAR